MTDPEATPDSSSPADQTAPVPPETGPRVLLAGGGTAGHVNPLLATAAALQTADPSVQLLVLGTATGLEKDLVPAAGLEMVTIAKVPLPRRPSFDLLRLPGRLKAAVDGASRAIEQLGAEVVVGFGGYVSTPAYLAARKAGVPVVIHEQNARPGLANRLGARWARAVALTFASTPLQARIGRTEFTGLPLRPEIAALVEQQATEAGRVEARQRGAAALGLDPTLHTLLVTGGSLGAQHLNEVLSAAMANTPAGVQVLHLTGKEKDAPVRAALEQAVADGANGLEARYHVLDYLPQMEHAYACADAVICRSGAGTVAELTALGLPALYVPLPIGNGEQRLNATDVVAAGGGRMVADAELSTEHVADFMALVAEATRRQPMAQAARGAGVRDGAQRLATLVSAVVRAARRAASTRA
ncbi:UDP-N-acetylglucosamine--N-acetylmuramyl-(pentapeptide) pyrophosphoryl-undecaprenol N-acetylglucosamine transferase [Actinomyces bovis]|uniref:UDP-N-acetylglucosamine--N-acetylmuramyl-(pentapeptide) pyrophosphoryl-undecaprenol N-acetylglucosamine transferase n=1 Tax=Actinomyces bovis TaxID=1658 RepID=A0ABY1VQA5_9ACTO|nr:undecaprenyldiphospho-muramoylpentapeptide beta-N-acetylglucosaminyltransferase [Actinomyces bovis]SPT53932.1 UDP-N-acetylglucosamine--N-acetylmuramyl-(pentapeptide) pyrophosphoryl-undecaprenol N-acetylglucosamine transferase [Actinomyces bovis]VEG53429.1 UDP-N-acetylglucosamine--N-acetylmuramyl-(pentapeptide) pyrophosphoryl-undecaprenol N-acetylglucosamine transferase [Actinomyces israelii]